MWLIRCQAVDSPAPTSTIIASVQRLAQVTEHLFADAMASSQRTDAPYMPVFQIIPGVQSYDWGKTAKQGSLVAQYAEGTAQLGFVKQDDKPYAELWMGTHPTLPSSVVPPSSSETQQSAESLVSLSSYLHQHPILIGDKVRSRFSRADAADSASPNDTSDGELPFLFKILSIGKALSIQAHPDKELAKKLHDEKPDMYKDDNHKPEMAIALTPFRGFCGFRPLKQIAHFLHAVSEFRSIVQQDGTLLASLDEFVKDEKRASEDERKQLLRQVFSNLMNADSKQVKAAVTNVAERYAKALKAGEKVEVDADLAQLVCTLNQQFPADVGVLCAFVLNVVQLQPGQAIFLKANEPHAYLDGEIVECMAASDNVVRAGLTPKARDVQVLVDMLTYDDTPSDEKRMQPCPFKPDGQSATAHLYVDADGAKADDVPSLLYDPPIDEFSVVRTTLQPSAPSETHRAISGPSLLIVAQGQGKLSSKSGPELSLHKPGQVFFIGADTAITLQATGTDAALITYRAFVEA